MSQKYEEVGACPQTMSVIAVQIAAGKCQYDRPTLVVNPADIAHAESIAKTHCFNVDTDEELQLNEWYVRYKEKAFGSIGC